MCEIAILRPDRLDANEIARAAKRIYGRMSHGLGIVAVIEGGPTYEYEVYRSNDPEWVDVFDFVFDNQDDATWFAIHGRLATSGERGQLGVHPLSVDECEECEPMSIIHNGIYLNPYRTQQQQGFDTDGHTLTTQVDTEIIAHQFGSVPSNLDECEEVLDRYPRMRTQGGFVLFGEDNIFIWSSSYVLTEDMEMFHKFRDFGATNYDHNYAYAVLTNEPEPDPTEEETEVPA